MIECKKCQGKSSYLGKFFRLFSFGWVFSTPFARVIPYVTVVIRVLTISPIIQTKLVVWIFEVWVPVSLFLFWAIRIKSHFFLLSPNEVDKIRKIMYYIIVQLMLPIQPCAFNAWTMYENISYYTAFSECQWENEKKCNQKQLIKPS